MISDLPQARPSMTARRIGLRSDNIIAIARKEGMGPAVRLSGSMRMTTLPTGDHRIYIRRRLRPGLDVDGHRLFDHSG